MRGMLSPVIADWSISDLPCTSLQSAGTRCPGLIFPRSPFTNVSGVASTHSPFREDDDVVARRVFVIRRDGPEGELLATPARHDDDDE